jgi:hypothetical protein
LGGNEREITVFGKDKILCEGAEYCTTNCKRPF